MDYGQLRTQSGMTLREVADLTGYGESTINGLERRGVGSARLKRDLERLYGARSPSTESVESQMRKPEELRETHEVPRAGLLVVLMEEIQRLKLDVGAVERAAQRLLDDERKV